MKADYIKPSIYNRVYRYMTYENALVLRLSLETGLRVGDCLKVKCEDISGRTLKFTAEKTDKPGKKILSAALVKELIRNGNGKGYCFKHRTEPNRHRTRQTVWADVKKAAERAGIAGHISPHSARKTYGVKIFHDKGMNAAQAELQHDRLDTTMLYVFSDLLTGQDGTKSSAEINYSTLANAAYEGCKRALTEFFKNSELTNSRK